MIMKLIRDEKVKYLFWGVATTVFYFVFRFIVNVLTNNPTIAAFLAEVVTIIFAFYVNRTFVFTNAVCKIKLEKLKKSFVIDF